jgi:hypothetical protein
MEALPLQKARPERSRVFAAGYHRLPIGAFLLRQAINSVRRGAVGHGGLHCGLRHKHAQCCGVIPPGWGRSLRLSLSSRRGLAKGGAILYPAWKGLQCARAAGLRAGWAPWRLAEPYSWTKKADGLLSVGDAALQLSSPLGARFLGGVAANVGSWPSPHS